MKIKELLISQIKIKGKINVSQFIEICQFSEYGYYIKKEPIGKKNDFITAPEISQMFGEILAGFLINYWDQKIKKEFNLIELGPGTGALISDILRTANINKVFLNSMNVILVEKNESLITKQKKILSNFNFHQINWIEDFNIKNNYKPSIIYSNEFFDCFPIRQFFKKNKWYEKFIKYNEVDDMFRFISEEVKSKKLLKDLEKFNNVEVAEISESRKKYFKLVCKFLRKNKGIFITIDYGYNDPLKNFSLQTIHNHKKTHLFENIGNQDITAYVNFNDFIDIANQYNLKIDLFCNQNEFLIGCGLKQRKEKLQKSKNNKTIKKIELEYERLTNKSQMGKIFKVLIVSCL